MAIVEAPRLKYQFRLRPYKHQRQGLILARKHAALGLFCEPGTGKSKIAVDYAGTLIEESKIRVVLIVCPLSVSGVWINEIRKNLPDKYRRRVINLSGEGRKIPDILKMARPKTNVTDFYIINYESLWRVQEALTKHLLRYGGENGRIYSKRLEHGFDYMWYDSQLEIAIKRVAVESGTVPLLVIADEVHQIKHRTAKKSRAVHTIAALTPYRLGLTGTPITNTPLDAFSEFRFIDPMIFGLNWNTFRLRYTIPGGYMNYKVIGWRGMDDFQRRLHAGALVVKKEECLDLPSKTYEIVPVELTTRTKTYYREMARRLVAEIEEYLEEIEEKGPVFQATARIVLTKLLRLSQITSGFVTDTEGEVRRVGTEKLKAVVETVENLIEENEKMVIFCRFRQEIKDLVQVLEKKRIPAHIIRGGVSAQQRTESIRIFQQSDKPMVMICQIASGSLGINLITESEIPCRIAIYYNLDYSVDHWLQSQDRIHRIGQKEKVTYLLFLAKGSIDEEVYESLQGKVNVAERILKRPRAILDRMKQM